MTIVVLSIAAVLALAAALAPMPQPRRTDRPAGPAFPRPPRARPTPLRRPSGRADPTTLAAWCDALARAMRGGITLRHALSTVPPPDRIAPSLAPALLALERGAPVAAALARVESTSHDLDLVLVVMRACAEHGGPAAEPIDRAAATLRQRAALAGERRTNSAQARMSALVMTCLPGAMLGLLVLTSSSVRGAAMSTLGVTAIVLGILLNLAGWGWMQRLIARTTR
jgi:tight adherence protein B